MNHLTDASDLSVGTTLKPIQSIQVVKNELIEGKLCRKHSGNKRDNLISELPKIIIGFVT